MTAKELFIESAYTNIKNGLIKIPADQKQDIYAISFYYYIENDDLRFPTIHVSYNTNHQYKKEIKNASSEAEAKWNFAFWLQDELLRIGGLDNALLNNWFKETPYYYSEEEDQKSLDDEDLFDDLFELGDAFDNEFIEAIILLTKRVFDEKIIDTIFGKQIPIIIHDLEYYEEPIDWTIRANPTGLVDEFLQKYNNGFI
ncbi:hypothetical protein [uncultured Cytophaga sp.]|uniref:hypothetical protein n=1 Tax=uncultured Cytophaga sp. TaxID=160238 RepID=UPI00262B4403|nr:hypothetical protein [uncultured Cytophaga sp.]